MDGRRQRTTAEIAAEMEKEIARQKERDMNKPDETQSEIIGAKLTRFEERKQQRVVSPCVDRKSIARAQNSQRKQNLRFGRKR